MHQKCVRCNIFLLYCTKLFQREGNSRIKDYPPYFYLLHCVFCAEDVVATHPPPIQQASECEPCQILIVAGKWIMGAGGLSVPMAMGRILLSWQ